MNKYIFLLFLFLISSVSSVSWSIEVIDDRGNSVTLSKPAKRIVSLAPFITELLFEIDAGESIIAVDRYSDFPIEATELPVVAAYQKFDIERIVALEPDLIIIWASGSRSFPTELFNDLSIPVYFSEPKSLAKISETILNFGKMTGKNSQAENTASAFSLNYSNLQQKYKNKEVVRVFYEIWPTPLITIGGQHIINDVFLLCGLDNIFSDTELLAPPVNIEMVINRNPQMIISSYVVKEGWKQAWLKWNNVIAVKNNFLFWIDPNDLTRHTSRILNGIRKVCEMGEVVRSSEML